MDVQNVDAERALRWGLIAVIVASTAGVFYFAAFAQTSSDAYTELYVLGTEGNASDYPTSLTVGERGELTVGVANHEHESRTYSLALVLENRTVDTRQLSLDEGEARHATASFSPRSTGRKTLEILLFESENPNPASDPYRRLWLQIEVSE